MSYDIYQTSVGEVRFSNLHKPDKYKNLSIHLFFDKKGLKEIKDKVKELVGEFIDANSTKAKPLTYVESGFNKLKENPEYPDELSGEVLVSFKQKASMKNKEGETFNTKIYFADSEAEPMEPMFIPNGSKVVLQYTTWIRSNDEGEVRCTLQPKAIQIIEMGELKASTNGPTFSKVKGGFTKADLPDSKGYDPVSNDDEEEDEEEVQANGFI